MLLQSKLTSSPPSQRTTHPPPTRCSRRRHISTQKRPGRRYIHVESMGRTRSKEIPTSFRRRREFHPPFHFPRSSPSTLQNVGSIRRDLLLRILSPLLNHRSLRPGRTMRPIRPTLTQYLKVKIKVELFSPLTELDGFHSGFVRKWMDGWMCVLYFACMH